MQHQISQLTPHLAIHHGCCNVGILRAGNRALLLDCGNGAVANELPALGIAQIEWILLTHHHRDSAAGIARLAAPATQIGVPAAERACFEQVEEFWCDPHMRWHLYNIHPHNLMLAESVQVHRAFAQGDQMRFGEQGGGGALISVLETPGHTDGSVTYLVEVDGQRIAFCGDLIYGEGQLWDLYHLQKGNGTVTDYHGFMGDYPRLLASLDKVLAARPTMLVSTHGVTMRDPARAVESLRRRLEQCYDRYVAISALRYYFPAMFEAYADRPNHMPIRAGIPVPDFLRHVSTSWIVVAENGEALVMDCGSPQVIEALQTWQASGEITQVTACWVTHYHDDHVDAMPEFQAAFDCATYADAHVAPVITAPRAWRLPCISPAVTRVDQVTTEGQSWRWNEFQLTAFHCPGQTYYHGGLLVEGRGLRLFFSGDSFTPAGIDDYCAGNRNLLGANVGFDQCLALIERLQPTHIFNCHVALAFTFTPSEIQLMRQNLAEREQLLGALFPWDHPNYGLDEHWVRCWPYEQDVSAGQTIALRVEFTNHSDTPNRARCRPILPAVWQMEIPAQEVIIPPKRDGFVEFTITIPPHVTACSTPGEVKRVIIPVDIDYAGRSLGQFREAILALQ